MGEGSLRAEPRLLDQVRQAIRVRHYSYRTEQHGWSGGLGVSDAPGVRSKRRGGDPEPGADGPAFRLRRGGAAVRAGAEVSARTSTSAGSTYSLPIDLPEIRAPAPGVVITCTRIRCNAASARPLESPRSRNRPPVIPCVIRLQRTFSGPRLSPSSLPTLGVRCYAARPHFFTLPRSRHP